MVTTRRAPVNSISWLFQWLSSCKKPIITYHCWQRQTVFYAWRLHVELTKNNWSHSQLSYKLGRNILKWLTLTAKQKETNTRSKLSRSYHLIMSIFSLFILSLSWKFSPQLDGKYSRRVFLLYLSNWLYLNRRKHQEPQIRAPHQLYLVGEVFRVRNKSSLTFFEWKCLESRFFLWFVLNGVCF